MQSTLYDEWNKDSLDKLLSMYESGPGGLKSFSLKWRNMLNSVERLNWVFWLRFLSYYIILQGKTAFAWCAYISIFGRCALGNQTLMRFYNCHDSILSCFLVLFIDPFQFQLYKECAVSSLISMHWLGKTIMPNKVFIEYAAHNLAS